MSLRYKKLLVAATIPLLLLTTSCVRLKARYEIKSEDKVNVAIDVGIKKNARGTEGSGTPSGQSVCGKNNPLANHEGSKSEPYEDEQYVGCRTEATVAAADLRKEDAARITWDEDFWEFRFKVSDANQQSGAEMVSDYEIKVTFPGKVVEASGSAKINGNTVIWDDPREALASEGLYAKAKKGGGLSGLPWLPIAITLLVLLAAAGLVVFLVLRNKKNAQPLQQGGYPHQPGAYPQQPGGYPQQPGTGYEQQPYSDYGQQPGQGYQQQSGSYPQQPGAYPQQPGGEHPQQPGTEYPQPGGEYPQQTYSDYGQHTGKGYPQQSYPNEQQTHPVDPQVYYSEPQQWNPDDQWRQS